MQQGYHKLIVTISNVVYLHDSNTFFAGRTTLMLVTFLQHIDKSNNSVTPVWIKIVNRLNQEKNLILQKATHMPSFN